MPDSIKLTTVTNSIAAQSITITKPDGTSGTLTIRDIDELTEAINQEQCPVLTPRPNDLVTGFSVTRDSFGADAAYKTANYVLHYILFYSPIAQGATLFEKYDNMVTAAAVILNHFATNTALTGSTEFFPVTVENFGLMQDATGTIFHGFPLAFAVSQFMET